MTKAISCVKEICDLHSEIMSDFKVTLSKAIRIGELLAKQKGRIEHGTWLAWIRGNLPFTARSAQRYVQLYDNRKQLKSDSVSHLGEAYKLLGTGRSTKVEAGPAEPQPTIGVEPHAEAPTPQIVTKEEYEAGDIEIEPTDYDPQVSPTVDTLQPPLHINLPPDDPHEAAIVLFDGLPAEFLLAVIVELEDLLKGS